MAQADNSQQKPDVNAELAALKADLAQLRGDMASLLEAVRVEGGERASSAKAQASEAIHERIDKLDREFRETLGKAQEQGKAAVDEVEGNIRKHPIATVLAAFGIGFVLAKLFDQGGRH